MKKDKEITYANAILMPLLSMIVAFIVYIPICFLTAKSSPAWFCIGLIYVILLAIISCFVIRKRLEQRLHRESDRLKFAFIYLFMQIIYQLVFIIIGFPIAASVSNVAWYLSIHNVDMNVIFNLTYKLSIYSYFPLIIILSVGIILLKGIKQLLKNKTKF